MNSSEVQTDAVLGFHDQDNSLKDLQRDVYYYRNANKELKSKLREVVAVNHRLAKTLKTRSESSCSNEVPVIPVAVE
jgi:hypothetical protein